MYEKRGSSTARTSPRRGGGMGRAPAASAADAISWALAMTRSPQRSLPSPSARADRPQCSQRRRKLPARQERLIDAAPRLPAMTSRYS
jgi:hypothetical protein